MKKHWWIALVLVFALAIPAAASQAIKIYVNGSELKTDVPAQIIDGRTMVPIRAIAEYFGKTVAWDSNSKTVSIVGQTDLDVVSAISAEWLTAGHASGKRPLAYAGIRNGCTPCHAGDQLQTALSDNPFNPDADFKDVKVTAADGTEVKGPYGYKMFDTSNADLPSPIDCATCHSGTGKEIMESGVIPAKLNVFSDSDLNVGSSSALCYTCHNGRRDVKEIYHEWADSDPAQPAEYPHHAVGALVTGQGGMEYPGVVYPSSKAHLSIGCVGCHMPETKEGYTSHEFAIQETTINMCTKCHVGQTEFTMGGNLKKELETKLAELKTLTMAKIPGAVDLGDAHSTFPAVDKDGKQIKADGLSLEALVGAYNHALIKQELAMFGKGAHNPQYAKALLNESIKRLK